MQGQEVIVGEGVMEVLSRDPAFVPSLPSVDCDLRRAGTFFGATIYVDRCVSRDAVIHVQPRHLPIRARP
jgi:hypothetical protein